MYYNIFALLETIKKNGCQRSNANVCDRDSPLHLAAGSVFS